MDIVKLVSQFATPAVLEQIASLLGVSQGAAQKGLGAAIPGVLAGLLGASKRPGITDALGSALSDAGGLGDLLGSNPAAAATKGSDLLSSLLGGDAAGALTGALGSYAGLPKAGAGSLLGLAGSMALGALGKEAASKGLDAGGVLGLLDRSKDEITGALPADFAQALGAAGLFAGLPPKAAAAAPRPPRRAAGPGRRSAPRRPRPRRRRRAAGPSGSSGWSSLALVRLAPQRALRAGARARGRDRAARAETTRRARGAGPSPRPRPRPTRPGTGARRHRAGRARAQRHRGRRPPTRWSSAASTSAPASARRSRASPRPSTGITDAASAQAALPKLTEARDALAGLEGTVSALPEGRARRAAADGDGGAARDPAPPPSG